MVSNRMCEYNESIHKSEYRVFKYDTLPDFQIRYVTEYVVSGKHYWVDHVDHNHWLTINNIATDIRYKEWCQIESLLSNTKPVLDKYRYDGKIRIKVEDWDNYIARKNGK